MLKLALRARHFFPYAPPKQRASQAIKYAEAVAWLGDRWILKQKVERHA